MERKILLLGDPQLYEISDAIAPEELESSVPFFGHV